MEGKTDLLLKQLYKIQGHFAGDEKLYMVFEKGIQVFFTFFFAMPKN